MAKQYIYALYSLDFPDEHARLSGCPEEQYFYVGRTTDPSKRKNKHRSMANGGSDYPYHAKIREAKNWEVRVLDTVDGVPISDQEEYFIVHLTCQGHRLLNLKRGDLIRERAPKLKEQFNPWH